MFDFNAYVLSKSRATAITVAIIFSEITGEVVATLL
jgi:hypothetical protein